MKLENVVEASRNNIDALDDFEECGCYFCIRTFNTDDIAEYVDNGTTALCPFCGVDAIIPGTVNKIFLEKAHERYFTGMKAIIHDEG
jgi:hypothetical protein